MTTPEQLLAQSILTREKRKAEAKAILNRPNSLWQGLFTVGIAVALGMYLNYLQRTEQPEVPSWVGTVLFIALFNCAINSLELWKTRRRLDAAIVLLELQEDRAD